MGSAKTARGAGRLALRGIGLLALVCSLAACGTVHRQGGIVTTLTPPAFAGAADPRISADDVKQTQALSQDIARRLADPSKPLRILALSGGGAEGAYGAGVIYGWSQSGARPEFAMVTGVSTGALAAPFAFLGPRWDGALRDAYTSGHAASLLKLNFIRALFSPSLSSPADLERVVERQVTPELLRQIAAEHAKGRRLLVVTTSLDTEQSVIWDMGAIATVGGPDAVQLFRRVLLASASIPGILPPVLVPGRSADGRTVEEMHVDGGVNAPFMAVPESLLLSEPSDGSKNGGAIYVLVNGQLGPEVSVTGGGLSDILARAYLSSSKASLRTLLAANLAFADRNGMSLYVSAIPPGVPSDSLDFAPKTMRRLFELGRSRAAAGQAWRALSNDKPVSPAAPLPTPR